jgi:hypothetical protein
MAAIIASGDFQGDQRAVTRVTIQPFQLGLFPYSNQVYASMLFTPSVSAAFELPNLKSLKWDRSTDNAVGACTFDLWNAEPLAPGSLPAQDGSFDVLGFLTYNRGETAYSRDVWQHVPGKWRNYVVPDRMVRVYQGYGADYTVFPENDPHMLLMGCYLIDEVEYTAAGTIAVTTRDLGAMLTDEIAFPPVVPFSQYPLKFSKYVTHAGSTTTALTATWRRPTYETDSNVPYVGVNGAVYGHHGTDAFDASDSTFWMSIGNAQPNHTYSFEYVQGKMNPTTINAARCKVWGGPYRVYLSVKVGSVWQGRAIVPYDPNNPVSAPNGANIPYIATGNVSSEGLVEFKFTAIAGVTAIRFTFTDLYNSGLGVYPYRAGVRRMEYATNATTTTTAPSYVTGNYGDYADLIKLFLAYGGFYWPRSAQQTLTGDGTTTDVVSYTFTSDDTYLKQGRIWGDVQSSGTAGVADLTVDIWDKKSLLDCIQYVTNILGYIIYIDEQGSAQVRSPNLYTLGNWQTDVNGLGKARVSTYRTIRDDQVILDLKSKLSSRNLREKVFVGNVPGKIGAVSNGRFPIPVNFRRVGGWTDQNFASAAEAQVMADLITLRQLFTYRQDSFRIPADPSIQCDDQVKLLERVTGENYFHYVSAISSNWEAATGVWTYDVTTSWLGTDPNGEWAFATSGLASETQAYLAALGH